MNLKVLIAFAAIQCCTIANADEKLPSTYETLVDDSGNISLPENLRRTGHFSKPGRLPKKMLKAVVPRVAMAQRVYTSCIPSGKTIGHFRKTGKFPDGAVIVKELLKATTASMTTTPCT